MDNMAEMELIAIFHTSLILKLEMEVMEVKVEQEELVECLELFSSTIALGNFFRAKI